MSDLIEREDAIKAIAETIADDGDTSAWLYVAEDMLNGVPSADRPQGWIPCSERMPKKEKATYLICTEDGYICSCRWTNVNPFWTDLTVEWHWCEFDIPQYNKAVAWMDLKPWKGVSNGEDIQSEAEQ